MVIALITAGGKGTRFKNNIPKQFIEINNKPLIVYTLEKFQNNNNIDCIIVSCLNEYHQKLMQLKEKYNISKLKWIAPNGNTQPESIYNCLNILQKNFSDDDIVVIHVANRPLVSNELINNSIIYCREKGNAITSIPCPEVLISKDKKEIINRDNILRIQTPQTFKLNDLIYIYEKAKEQKIKDVATTCDLMIRLGKKVNFIEGSSLNLKITYPEDIIKFKSLLLEGGIEYEGKTN